jgi:hypothetical protein
MAAELKLTFDAAKLISAIDNYGAGVQRLIRPSAQKGAQVFFDEVYKLCPESDAGHYFYGTSYRKTGQKYFFEKGNLRRSIYQVYSKANSSDFVATYHIAWNHKKAPYGFMVENGTSRWPAGHPFLRPAYDGVGAQANQAAEKNLFSGIQALQLTQSNPRGKR